MQVQRSVVFLLLISALFASPIVLKTLYAHGLLAAAVTGALVFVMIALGPLAFVVAQWVESELTFGGAALSAMQWLTLGVLTAVMLAMWWRRAATAPALSFPYLPVMAWAMTGVTFCLVHLFVHIG